MCRNAEWFVMPGTPESCLSALCDGDKSPISPLYESGHSAMELLSMKGFHWKVMHRFELVIPTPVGLVTRTLSKVRGVKHICGQRRLQASHQRDSRSVTSLLQLCV